jgi:hypothetical protein
LNDEGIIISSTRMARNTKIFEPHAGVGILGIFDDVRGCVEPRRKRRLLDPFREGPWPTGVWARAASSILIVPRTLVAVGFVGESAWLIVTDRAKLMARGARR